MSAAILVASGLFAMVYGCWRGWTAARAAMVPFVRGGDATRALVESTQPVHARSRVRVVARQVTLAVGWIAISMYGMYLATVGLGPQS